MSARSRNGLIPSPNVFPASIALVSSNTAEPLASFTALLNCSSDNPALLATTAWFKTVVVRPTSPLLSASVLRTALSFHSVKSFLAPSYRPSSATVATAISGAKAANAGFFRSLPSAPRPSASTIPPPPATCSAASLPRYFSAATLLNLAACSLTLSSGRRAVLTSFDSIFPATFSNACPSLVASPLASCMSFSKSRAASCITLPYFVLRSLARALAALVLSTPSPVFSLDWLVINCLASFDLFSRFKCSCALK